MSSMPEKMETTNDAPKSDEHHQKNENHPPPSTAQDMHDTRRDEEVDYYYDDRKYNMRAGRSIRKGNKRRRRNDFRNGRNHVMKLQIKNLDYAVTENELLQLLEVVAPVEKAMIDRADGGRSAGSATVTALGKHAMSIMKAFQGVAVQFRNMKISIVVADMGPPRRRSYAGGRDYKNNSKYEYDGGEYRYDNNDSRKNNTYHNMYDDDKRDYHKDRHDYRNDGGDNFYNERGTSNVSSAALYNPDTYKHGDI